MSEEEALSVLNVSHKSTKWLLKQVHPDKHPDHRAEAEAATARVNQARDVALQTCDRGLRCARLCP